MANTRKRKRAERADWDLLPRVRAQLANTVPSGSRILVALSGGVDSIVLLDLLRRLAVRRRFDLAALHVNHQLQFSAPAWASFCRRVCRAAGVPLRVVKVEVTRGNSVEGAARTARYEALLKQRADYIALAHNQDDQVETVLLHLLRGTGIRGLAGMRVVSHPPAAARGNVRLLRPLLDVPRSIIERYAEHRKLEWIEDPSNATVQFSRNYLRAEVLPRIAERFPSYRDALARAARHAAEAACVLDEVAQQDAGSRGLSNSVDIAALRKLTTARAKNALSAFLRRSDIEIPSTQRIEEALRQVLAARADASICIDFGAKQLRRQGTQLVVIDARKPPRPVERAWSGEARLELSELGGTLNMKRARGAGISAARLRAAPVTIRTRSGGERMRPNAAGPTRTIKNLMQEARMPAWQRDRVPLIYCGDELVCVPGLAIASSYQARPGESCIIAVWHSG